jgi:hypothetical protein
MPRTDLRAARANRVFCTDKKHIRAKDTVMDNTKQDVDVLHKIVYCVRMAFHPCAIDDPRGRLLVRATSQLRNHGDAI